MLIKEKNILRTEYNLSDNQISRLFHTGFTFDEIVKYGTDIILARLDKQFNRGDVIVTIYNENPVMVLSDSVPNSTFITINQQSNGSKISRGRILGHQENILALKPEIEKFGFYYPVISPDGTISAIKTIMCTNTHAIVSVCVNINLDTGEYDQEYLYPGIMNDCCSVLDDAINYALQYFPVLLNDKNFLKNHYESIAKHENFGIITT